MPRYKRSAQEAELDLAMVDEQQYTPEQHETLAKLRNMWEFASFMQYVFIFGAAVKISEDFDIEDLEHECLQPQPSSQLADMALTLLKYVSSHRGLTHDIFAEYTRRQYFAKAPERNPFGDDEDPIPFNDLDIYSRIRVLQQLSTWTFTNPDRMRSLMPEDDDHLDWRIEPLGWDADDRSYFVLDDNRLYRRTDDEPPQPTPPKVKSKPKPKVKATRGTRTSKRRKIDSSDDEGPEEVEAQDVVMTDAEQDHEFGFTERTWECIAITLDEYRDFLATIRRSRDPNEKALRSRIENDVLPIIEKRAEALKAKEMKKLRDLENLQKMATAKRSSRIADKADRAAKEQEEREAEEKHAADLRMARQEQERQRRIEEGHESRRLTREQRLKEREVKRILHEEELARLDREASTAASQPDDHSNGVRLSSRNLQTQKEAHQRELERLQQSQQEDRWYFDCVICGMHGENLDDGSHSVACEKCNVWQHSKCHGFTPEQCEDENFHFVCRSCRKKEKAAVEERSGITLKLGKRPSESPVQSTPPIKKEAVLPEYVQQQLANMEAVHQPLQNGHVLPRPQQSQPLQIYYPSTAVQSHAQQIPLMHQHSPGSHSLIQQTPSRNHVQPSGITTHHQQTPTQYWQSMHHNQPAQSHAHLQQGADNRTYRPQVGSSPMLNRNQQHQAVMNASMNHAQPHQGANSPASNHTHLQRPASNHTHQQQPAFNHMQHHQMIHNHAVNGVAVQQHGAFSSQARSLQPHPAQSNYQPPPSHFSRQLSSPLPQQDSRQQPSPRTTLPPPPTDLKAAVSPEKSSPPRSTSTANGQHASPQPNVDKMTTLATPSTSFDSAPKLTTPIKNAASPVPPGTDSLAASGMRGPWPDGSMNVPQKHGPPQP